MTSELKPCPFCGGEAKLYGGPDAQENYSVWCEGGHRINGNFKRDETVAKWNTRAVPDVPELVRYRIWFDNNYNEIVDEDPEGEYVRYNQAAKVIAAEREKAQVLEQQLQSDDDAYSSGFDAGFGEANMTRNKRADAAEAKLAAYEKQEPVAWQHAITYPDGVKYIGVLSKTPKPQARPLYAAPAPMPSHDH